MDDFGSDERGKVVWRWTDWQVQEGGFKGLVYLSDDNNNLNFQATIKSLQKIIYIDTVKH